MNNMEFDAILVIIIKSCQSYFEDNEQIVDVDANTTLFGENSELDSMGLVNVVVDIESRLLDEGYEISLTSEKAMSRKNSPFRTITTLAEFIKEQMNN